MRHAAHALGLVLLLGAGVFLSGCAAEEYFCDEEGCFYCDGIGCNASTKGALNLTRLGFRVKELLGGLDWWKRDGYPTEGEAGQQGDDTACGC